MTCRQQNIYEFMSECAVNREPAQRAGTVGNGQTPPRQNKRNGLWELRVGPFKRANMHKGLIQPWKMNFLL